MQNIRKYIAAAIFMAASAVFCGAIPQKPEPQRLVNDFAGLLTAQKAKELEGILVAFDDSTSNQIAVVTVSDLEGIPVSEYAARIGISWQVGSSGFNNGIVVLVKPKTEASGGEVAISTGYGLEGAIPDVYCKRIIEDEMLPHFRNGDYAGGIYAACEVLMQLASGEISEPRRQDDNPEEIAIAVIMVIIMAIIFFAVLSSKGGGNGNGGSSNGSDDGDIIAKSIIIGNIIGNKHGNRPWNGHAEGGFGGFGGGSFGGFGGGSFGGGGASGRW